MSPANERLDPDERACGELDGRLVVDDELLVDASAP